MSFPQARGAKWDLGGRIRVLFELLIRRPLQNLLCGERKGARAMPELDILHTCGHYGTFQQMMANPMNREKVQIRIMEHGVCRDCFHQQRADTVLSRWGHPPSVDAVSEKQAAFATRVLMKLLGSGRVPADFADLIMSTPNLPVRDLLDIHQTTDHRDMAGCVPWEEGMLRAAYRNLWAQLVAIRKEVEDGNK